MSPLFRLMRPLALTFPWFLIFGVAFVWAFVAEARVIRRAQKGVAADGAPADRGSLRAVMFTQGAAFFIVFFLAWKPYGRFADQRAAFWIGLAIYVGAAILRRLCFRALGQSFTGEVRVRADQTVITRGPYRWIRHPSYSAGMLMVVGVAILVGTWLGAIIALALTASGYAYRVRVEEQALASTLGAPYVEYSARTKRFIPFLV